MLFPYLQTWNSGLWCHRSWLNFPFSFVVDDFKILKWHTLALFKKSRCCWWPYSLHVQLDEHGYIDIGYTRYHINFTLKFGNLYPCMDISQFLNTAALFMLLSSNKILSYWILRWWVRYAAKEFLRFFIVRIRFSYVETLFKKSL